MMNVYPSSWAALIAAFNTSAYSELKGPKWGQFIRDGWGSDFVDIRQLSDNLNQKEWIAQAGAVRSLLRSEMSFTDYAWLQATHTFAISDLRKHIANPHNGLFSTLVPDILADDRIPAGSKLKNTVIVVGGVRMQMISPLVMRAISVDLYPEVPTLEGEAKYKTINNWQTLVRKIVGGHRVRTREAALNIIEERPELAKAS